MKFERLLVKTAWIITAVFVFLSHASAQQLYEFSANKNLMGTKMEITAVCSSVDSMKKAIFYSLKEIERIQEVMSTSIDSSEVYKINMNSGIMPVKVSYETYSIIERSISYSEKYDGLFDITIGPITELWGFNTDDPVKVVPDKKVIDSLIKLVSFKKIQLNPIDTTVFLTEKGMKIDLGGIAKGYAVDRASKEMKKHGIRNFVVNGGGDLYVSGEKAQGQKWVVGIKHPREETKLIATLEVSNYAVGTSGDYERFTIIDGKRYNHIFNTRSGYPVTISESGTALASTTEEAVILSKILFIYGADKYEELKDKVPGVIIDSDGKVVFDMSLKEYYNFRLMQ